jgi:hypothetical protein
MYTSTGVYVARFPHTYLLLLVPTFTGNLNLTSNIHLNRQENYTHESAKYSLLLSCRDLTGRRDWDTLHLLRGSNGNVPWWMPSLPNHDDRSLVQRCLPAIHSQASRRVQPRSLAKNANPYVPQEHSRLFVTHSFTSRLKATQPSQ